MIHFLRADFGHFYNFLQWFTWKRCYRFFSNFAYKLCRLTITVAMVAVVAWKPMRKQTLVICWKGGVVSRKSKFILYAKFWFQKIHSKAKKTVASFHKPAWITVYVLQNVANYIRASLDFQNFPGEDTPGTSTRKLPLVLVNKDVYSCRTWVLKLTV